MENDIKQSCKNCKDYRAHYIKQPNRLQEIDGHCVNDEWKKINKRNGGRLHDNCPFWVHATVKIIEEHRASIKKTIETMKKRLDEILLILIDDKDMTEE